MRIHALLPGTKSNRKKITGFFTLTLLTELLRIWFLFKGSFTVVKILFRDLISYYNSIEICGIIQNNLSENHSMLTQ
jgi:hypothetical protein